MTIIAIKSKDQLDEVLANNPRVVIDFYAEWCAPCKALMPIVEELSNMVADKFTFVKIDINSLSELTSQYDVRTIPNLLVFKDGVKVSSKSGMSTKIELLRLISNAN